MGCFRSFIAEGMKDLFCRCNNKNILMNLKVTIIAEAPQKHSWGLHKESSRQFAPREQVLSRLVRIITQRLLDHTFLLQLLHIWPFPTTFSGTTWLLLSVCVWCRHDGPKWRTCRPCVTVVPLKPGKVQAVSSLCSLFLLRQVSSHKTEWLELPGRGFSLCVCVCSCCSHSKGRGVGKGWRVKSCCHVVQH